jgi:hypothetical protein
MQFTSAIYEPTSSSYTSTPKSGILRNTFNYLTNQNVNFNIIGVSKKGAANVIEFDADTDSNPILSGPIDDGYGVILNAEFIPARRDTSQSAPQVMSPYTPPVPVVTALPTTAVSYIKPGQVVNAPSVSDVTSQQPQQSQPSKSTTSNQSTLSTLSNNTSKNLLYVIIFVLVIAMGCMYYKMKESSIHKMGGGAIGGLVTGAQFAASTILGGIGYAIGGTVGSFGVKKMSGGNKEGSDQGLPEGIKGGNNSQNNSLSKRVRFGGNNFIRNNTMSNTNLLSIY